MTTTVAPGRPTATGVAGFVRRRPLTSFFLWHVTVGQAFAFAPVIALLNGVELPFFQLFIVASTLAGLLLPAVVVTRVAEGPGAVRELWRRAFAVRVGARWYALPLLVVPAVAVAVAVLLLGPPALGAPGVGTAVASAFLLSLLLTFLPNNWWEEVAWTGFVQARLQDRLGPARAAVATGVLFALQHVVLVVAAGISSGWAVAAVLLAALVATTIPFRFVTGWAYNRTGSLFLVGLVHGTSNAVATGSGFGPGALAVVYPDGGVVVGLMHLFAMALIGFVVLAATRGRLGLRTAGAQR